MSSRPTDIETNDPKAMKMANKDRMAGDHKTPPAIPENRESDKNLLDMLEKHRRETFRRDSVAHSKHHKASLNIGRDNFHRTTSMLSYLSGIEDDEIMTNKYKYVTTSVLWFCYFSLVCLQFHSVRDFL